MVDYKKLLFDYKIGDVVLLSNGLLAIIEENGGYDNQYWCDICYPDGIHLGAANWFSTNKLLEVYIVGRCCNEEKEKVLNELKCVMNKYSHYPIFESEFYQTIKRDEI